MVKENNKQEVKAEQVDKRSVFYDTKKKFANVFVYAEDMIALGFDKEVVEKMTNGDINTIFREKLKLPKKIVSRSGSKKELIGVLGLTEEATQGEINDKVLEMLKTKK